MHSIQLPFPPLCATFPANAYREGETAVITLKDGNELTGELLAFKIDESLLTLRVESKKRIEIRDFTVNDIRMMRLPKLRKMVRLSEPLGPHGKRAVMPPRTQEFEVLFRGGEKLEGDTFSFRLDRNGLHLFRADGVADYNHVFIPFSAIKDYRIGPLLGVALVKQKLVTPEDIESGLAEQKRQREQPLGEYLKSMVIVSAEVLEEALERQRTFPHMRLGELLLKENVINQTQLNDALREQERNRKTPLGDILVSMGIVSQKLIKQTLAKKLGIPFVDLSQFQIDSEILRLVPEEIARRYQIMPLYMYKDVLVFAVEDPMQWQTVEALRFLGKINVEAVTATSSDISWAIEEYYSSLQIQMYREHQNGVRELYEKHVAKDLKTLRSATSQLKIAMDKLFDELAEEFQEECDQEFKPPVLLDARIDRIENALTQFDGLGKEIVNEIRALVDKMKKLQRRLTARNIVGDD